MVVQRRCCRTARCPNTVVLVLHAALLSRVSILPSSHKLALRFFVTRRTARQRRGRAADTVLLPCTRTAPTLQERETIRLKREAKVKGGFYVEPEAKLAFVMRIRGLNKIHPKVWRWCRHQQ